jgi:hypothetical protein
VQLQIIPTTIGFPLTAEVLELALAALVVLEEALELLELLEPHALMASATAGTVRQSSSRLSRFE